LAHSAGIAWGGLRLRGGARAEVLTEVGEARQAADPSPVGGCPLGSKSKLLHVDG
jgi:hypothetical protein